MLSEFFRRRREIAMGRKPLSLRSARNEPAKRDDSADFAIGLMTGIPMPSPSGVIGAMMHDSGSHHAPSYSAPDPTPSSSSDSLSSSSSYDSSPSSSSYDSGSYSAPSDSGGL